MLLLKYIVRELMFCNHPYSLGQGSLKSNFIKKRVHHHDYPLLPTLNLAQRLNIQSLSFYPGKLKGDPIKRRITRFIPAIFLIVFAKEICRHIFMEIDEHIVIIQLL